MTERPQEDVLEPVADETAKVGKEHHLAVVHRVDKALSAQRNLTATKIHQAGAVTKIEDWDALHLHHE